MATIRRRHVTAGRARPIGWSPGTGALLGAWVASAAIARLTGATAVIMLLAATIVAFGFEIVAGWRAGRSVRIRTIVVPRVVTVGEPCRLLVAIDASTSSRAIERRRITVTTPLGDGAAPEVDSSADSSTVFAGDGSNVAVVTRFETPGVLTQIVAHVDAAGPAGLIWWRRSTAVDIDGLCVAPMATGALLEVEQTTTTADGSTTARRGTHGGEVDGVRPWRQGDSTSTVHWPSSLRIDELIVHDRTVAADQRWIVALDRPEHETASRLRRTLDEGRHRGHDVSVRTADGELHQVTDADGAAQWAAIAAQAATDAELGSRGDERSPRRVVGVLQREIRVRPTGREVASAIGPTTRWSTAAAAFASVAMLIGALDGSAVVLSLVAATMALAVPVSLWVARRSGRRPAAMQVAMVAAILLALGSIVVRTTGVDGLVSALRGPMPDLLILLVVLHGFEVIDRRTLRVHLAITLVIASYAAGLRIDDALGWWLTAWGASFLVAILTVPRLLRCRREGLAPTGVASPGAARTAGRWIGSFAAIGVVTLGVLTIVPVPDGPARIGLPALLTNERTVDTPGALAAPDGSSTAGRDAGADRGSIGETVGYPGFTETLDTSIRGDLGDDIVMRVRSPEPAFWRGQTFTEFDGRTWTVSPANGQARTGPVIDVPPALGDPVGRGVPTRELVQTYFVETDLPNIVFGAYRPVQVIFGGPLWTRPDGALRSDTTLSAGSIYTVISERPLVDAEILRAQGDLGEFFERYRAADGGDALAAFLDPFLELPDSTTDRTVELAAALRTPGESTYDTILAYEAWLGANTEYDLDAPVPADGADAVDDFLFESRRGFCEQIASTLAVMLRSQGVPARLATGYVAGERDRVSGVWEVRARDAHAWVEVWFPQTGWQAFDPTAEVPLAADADAGTVGGDLIGATVSSIVSLRVEIALVAIGAVGVWGLARLVASARHRRRRGRWGLLQDRFSVLARSSVTSVPDPAMTATPPVLTNRQLASGVATSDLAAEAEAVASELDRAAFDPTWIDDDERYERTRAALTTLERSRR